MNKEQLLEVGEIYALLPPYLQLYYGGHPRQLLEHWELYSDTHDAGWLDIDKDTIEHFKEWVWESSWQMRIKLYD